MGLLSSVIGAGASIIGGERANRANAKESKRNRKFQERMSSTAHQREVKDLIAAGLNPILSATGGGGASTPGGSMARMENSARDVSSNISKTAQLKTQIEATKAGTNLNNEQAAVAAETAKLVKEKILTEQATAKNMASNANIREMESELFTDLTGLLEAKIFAPIGQAFGLKVPKLPSRKATKSTGSTRFRSDQYQPIKTKPKPKGN